MDEEIEISIYDMSYFECMDCRNHFYVRELPQGINDPNFCPYCGVTFTEGFDVSGLL